MEGTVNVVLNGCGGNIAARYARVIQLLKLFQLFTTVTGGKDYRFYGVQSVPSPQEKSIGLNFDLNQMRFKDIQT